MQRPCFFCHKEGFRLPEPSRMSADLIKASIHAAKVLGIKRVAISGGEPTVLDELPEVIEEIRGMFPNGKITLVTNGYHLVKLMPRLGYNIDTVDIAITSFRKEVFERFSGVNPAGLLTEIPRIKPNKLKVNINIPVVEDNCGDLRTIVARCLGSHCSVTLMLPIVDKEEYPDQEKAILAIIDQFDRFHIRLANIPCLVSEVESGCYIMIKLPVLSRLIKWASCASCGLQNECAEGVCGIRVYPDGSVSSCLHLQGVLYGDSSDVGVRIRNCLKQLLGNRRHWSELLDGQVKSQGLLGIFPPGAEKRTSDGEKGSGVELTGAEKRTGLFSGAGGISPEG